MQIAFPADKSIMWCWSEFVYGPNLPDAALVSFALFMPSINQKLLNYDQYTFRKPENSESLICQPCTVMIVYTVSYFLFSFFAKRQ